MYTIQTLVVGQLKTNCYLIYANNSDKSLIIDPGDEADFIIQKINDYGVIPVGIIATHAHFDHIQAVAELKLAFNIPFYLHAKDKFLLQYYRSSAKYFTGIDPGPAPSVDKFIKEGDVIKTENMSILIIETPGHTPGCVCLYNKNEKIIFSGDTIFANGDVGRTDHKYSDPLVFSKSVKKILSLSKATIVYPGHGPKTTIGQEFKKIE